MATKYTRTHATTANWPKTPENFFPSGSGRPQAGLLRAGCRVLYSTAKTALEAGAFLATSE